MKNSWIKFLIHITTIALIILFVYAAVSKVMDMNKFQVQLGQSPILTQYAKPVSWIIPAIEILISILLFTEKFRLWGLVFSFGLMLLFSGYIVIITRFSEYVPCSCGGILEKMSWDQHLIFNLSFVILSLIAFLLYQVPDTRSLLQQNQD